MRARGVRAVGRVHGEVAAHEVVLECSVKIDLVRMTKITVGRFSAIGCHLDYAKRGARIGRVLRYFFVHYSDGSVRIFIKCIREKSLYFLGFCIGCDIPIFRRDSAIEIAHASADQVCLETGPHKGFDDQIYFFRYREFFHR